MFLKIYVDYMGVNKVKVKFDSSIIIVSSIAHHH